MSSYGYLYIAAFPVDYEHLYSFKFIIFEILFLIDFLLTFITDIHVPKRSGGMMIENNLD